MPGTPQKTLKRELIERLLRQRAQEEFGPEGTVTEYIEFWLASGETMQRLADDLTQETGVQLWRERVRAVIDAQPELEGEDVNQRLAQARAKGAHALAERMMSRAEAIRDKDDAQIAAVQLRTHQWYIERINAAEFGPKQQAGVTVNIGSLSIDALRQPRPANVIATVIPEDTKSVSADAPIALLTE